MGEKTITRDTVFEGRAISVEVAEVELDCGAKASREIVRHPGAVAVVAQLPDERFIFVRQFRKPIDREILEIAAGTLDPDESPETCARRELTEETGYVAKEIVEFGPVFNAPGYSDESIHLYYTLVDSERRDTNPDDDERIEVVYLSAEDVDEKILCGEISDSKTIAAWWFYQKRVVNGGCKS